MALDASKNVEIVLSVRRKKIATTQKLLEGHVAFPYGILQIYITESVSKISQQILLAKSVNQLFQQNLLTKSVPWSYFCLWGASLVVVLVVGSLPGRNSACGEALGLK